MKRQQARAKKQARRSPSLRRKRQILVVTPAPPGSRKGNRVTAERWAGILRKLGHKVRIQHGYDGEPADLLIALHARKSAAAVRQFAKLHADRPIIVALTGTDLYHDLKRSSAARKSLELAHCLVLLQPEGLKELPRRVRQKGLVILQSVELPPAIRARRAGLRKGRIFRVCVLGHLRAVKDPFRAALASRQLPWNSGIQVFQIGGATSDGFAKRAKAETEGNLRYRWAGEWPRGQALRFLAGCDALVLSSKMEGGANVISEAITIGVPVIASRIPGSVGLLGKNYPGFFPVGDTAALGKLLRRLETEPRFYRRLQQRCRELRSMFHPSRERRAWSQLLSEAFKNQRPRSP